jgi:hypothetical protein
MAVSLKGFDIPVLDYNNTLFSDEPTVPGLQSIVKTVYVNVPYKVINTKTDYGSAGRSRAIVVNGTVYYVMDYRHSHDLEMHDLTTFSTKVAGYSAVLIIDYGSVINAKVVAFLISYWNSGGSTTAAKMSISTDNTTYTDIWSFTLQTSTEVLVRGAATNVSFRYLRFSLGSDGVNTTYGRLRKVVIIV